MRIVMILAATVGLVAASGCSRTLANQRAAYREHKADTAAAKGDYYKAAEQQRKADIAKRDAARAPLP
jgi:hypothetical protein